MPRAAPWPATCTRHDVNARLSPGATQTERYLRRQEAALDAAAGLFNRHGVKGATLAEVARELGLATSGITYYHRRKEDLASACFLRAIEAQSQVVRAASVEPTLEGRVRALLQGCYRIEQDIALGRRGPLILFNEIRALPESHSGRVFEAYTGMFRGVRQLLREPLQGLARPALNARSHLLLSMANSRGLVRHHDPSDLPALADRVADILIAGLAGPRSRWSDALPAGLGRPGPGGPSSGGQDFLQAATALVNQQGFRGASVARIAARLNLTKGSFYHHHEHKDDLIAACFAQTFSVIRETIDLARAAPGSGWDRLGLISRRLVAHQLSAAGPLLRVTALSALPPDSRAPVQQTRNRQIAQLRALVVDGQIDGSVRIADQAVAAYLVDAMINAAAELPTWAPGVHETDAPRLFAAPLLMGLGWRG
jgi:AcrR family transcriptional regulator